MELRLTFAMVAGDDFDTSTYMPRSLVGLSPDDITAIATEEARALDPAATATLEAGSIGKGASGPAGLPQLVGTFGLDGPHRRRSVAM